MPTTVKEEVYWFERGLKGVIKVHICIKYGFCEKDYKLDCL